MLQAAAPPVGFVEVATSPAPSTAAHSDTEGQDSAVNPPATASFALCHPVSAAGFVVQNTYPAVSTATHNDTDTQEIPDNDAEHVRSPQLLLSIRVKRQARAPLIGSLDVATFPDTSTAAQSDFDGQAIALSLLGPGG
jgi:hypothetical protein